MLNAEQIRSFKEQGFLFLPAWLPGRATDAINAEMITAIQEESDSPAVIWEKNHQAVRGMYGLHLNHPFFADVIRWAPLLNAAREVLESELFLYQLKVNTKAAFVGDQWEWHQDFPFWHHEDQLPEPRILTAALFLDEVTEFNGPVCLVPGSHQDGMLSVSAQGGNDTSQPAWMSNLTVGLKYALSNQQVADQVNKRGMVAPKGPAGSLLLFHGNMVHGSGTNISPFARHVCLLTYCCVDNLPRRKGAGQRPDFLVARDFAPLVARPLPPHLSDRYPSVGTGFDAHAP